MIIIISHNTTFILYAYILLNCIDSIWTIVKKNNNNIT